MAACRGGHLSVLQWLLQDAGAADDASACDDLGSTPLAAACEHGHLHIAVWLLKHIRSQRGGLALDARAARLDGSTPMMLACRNGHLHVAQWLFGPEGGAAGDVRTSSSNGHTPMLAVCLQGHADVAKWLVMVGAADDVRRRNASGWSPMRAAASLSNLDMTLWLLLQGAADGPDGHVDAALLLRDVGPWDRRELRASLAAASDSHEAFARLVLGAVSAPRSRTVRSVPEQEPGTHPEPPLEASATVKAPGGCVLPALCGLEVAVLAQVAQYAGIITGRKLRTAREAIAMLGEAEDKEVF